MATVSGVTYDPIVRSGVNAGADYSSASNYLFMTGHTTDDEAVTCGANGRIIGIRGNKPASQAPVELHIGGISMIYLGGTVTAYANVKSDADGKAVASTTDKENQGGIVLRAGVSGDLVPILLLPGRTLSAS